MAPKKGLKIGEVCKLLDIQPYVLRYWETEFVALHPAKSQSGQRVYAEAEVAVIRRIKELLYDEGYTIAGAKKKLESRESEAGGAGAQPTASTAQLFEPVAKEGEEKPEGEPEDPRVQPGVSEAAAQLDTAAAERIESLLRGVQEALEEARAALILLERHPH